MTIDPFTTPAEAEREGLARQARDFFALAMTPTRLVKSTYDGAAYRYSYEEGVQALRDALVGQGHATLAVNANLDRIADALEALTTAPSALAEISRQVHDLTGTLDQGVEFADSTAAAVGSVAETVHELADAVDRLAEPRPRWWQLKLRRALRQQTTAEGSDLR